MLALTVNCPSSAARSPSLGARPPPPLEGQPARSASPRNAASRPSREVTASSTRVPRQRARQGRQQGAKSSARRRNRRRGRRPSASLQGGRRRRAPVERVRRGAVVGAVARHRVASSAKFSSRSVSATCGAVCIRRQARGLEPAPARHAPATTSAAERRRQAVGGGQRATPSSPASRRPASARPSKPAAARLASRRPRGAPAAAADVEGVVRLVGVWKLVLPRQWQRGVERGGRASLRRFRRRPRPSSTSRRPRRR